jgi:hypothetical protein
MGKQFVIDCDDMATRLVLLELSKAHTAGLITGYQFLSTLDELIGLTTAIRAEFGMPEPVGNRTPQIPTEFNINVSKISNMNIKPNNQAFPLATRFVTNTATEPDSEATILTQMIATDFEPGLTVRAHLAGLAMQGLLASGESGSHHLCVIRACKMADMLIDQLNREEPEKRP